jgi:hypothetical protein
LTRVLVLRNCCWRPAMLNSPSMAGGEFADQGILMRGIDHFRQVARARYIGRGQPGRILKTGIGEPQSLGLPVHGGDESLAPAGIMPRQGRSGAIFRRHQRQAQHFLARELGADLEARAGALDDNRHRPRRSSGSRSDRGRIQRHHRRHQLGDRCDRQHGAGILLEKDRAGRLVLHQYRRGLQREMVRIVQRCRRCGTSHAPCGLRLAATREPSSWRRRSSFWFAGLGPRRRSTGADYCGSQQHH